MKDCDAILLAAGKSKRLGFDKIMTPLAGKTALEYSLNALIEAPSIQRIILTTRKDLIDPIQKLTQNKKKPVDIIEGGIERQDSVFNGLQQATSKYVLIHDAARPLLTSSMIEKLLEQARKTSSAVCAQRATDTVKRATEEGIVRETLNRSEIWLMKTPQVFERAMIAEAYAYIQKNKIQITDDAAAVEQMGKPVHLVDVESFNLKITRETDWKLIDLWLKQESLAEARKAVHAVCNQINPMIGYLPLLEKYGGDHAQFKDYLNKMKLSAAQLQALLPHLQMIAKQISPDSPE
ncbi:MAG: 2-C-methyl-D-erythritol 4-phosphate cytidylyltransferase [Verrucomicrobiota bacterium]